MAGSFWSNFGMRFNPNASSGLDELLEKGEGNFTLEEVISHDQVIQECKYMNQQLCEYLSKPHVIRQLVQYVIAAPPASGPGDGDPLAVGGSSDDTGGITNAASMKRRRDKERLAAEADAASKAAASAAAANSSAEAAATPADAADEHAREDSAHSDLSDHRDSRDISSDDDDDSDTDSVKHTPLDDAETRAEAEQKYPYQASELFSCEVVPMLDALFEECEEEEVDNINSTAQLGEVAEEDEGDKSSDSSAAAAATTAAASAAPTTPASLASPTTASAPSSSPAASSSPAFPPVRRLPLLDLLLSFLDQPAPIDPAHASYFRKVMVVLIQRKYTPLVRYMSTHGTLDKLLAHIGLYSAMELLIMIGWDDGLGGNQDVEWLVANDLTGKLIEKLDPVWETVHHQPDVVINASRALVDVVVKCPAATFNPLITRLLDTHCQQRLFTHMFSGSLLSLSNALSIVIVLVQRYANRMDLGEEILDEVVAANIATLQAAAREAPEDDEVHAQLQAAINAASENASALPEPFHSLVPHLPAILRLLSSEQPAEESWSYGRGRAFGETRLKVVELILVLVRCKVSSVETIFRSERLLDQLLGAFVAYPWNNMLHGLVESIIRTVLEFLTDTELKPALFIDARLADRVVDAYEANEAVCARGPGFRLGYMGHLLRTAEVVEQYLLNAENDASVAGQDVASVRLTILGSAEAVARWSAFVAGPLTVETERCKVILPVLGGDDDDFAHEQDDVDADSLAANFALQSQSHSHGDTHDYAFDPDDTSSLAYEYGAQAEVEHTDWADFNQHFADAAIGESPGASSPSEEDGAGVRGRSHLAQSAQRQLMEFALHPDEDDDDDDDDADDDTNWADFGNTAAIAAAQTASAAAPPGSPSAAQQTAAAAAVETSLSADATTAPAPDNFDDFEAEFPQ